MRVTIHAFGSLGDLHPYLAVAGVLKNRGNEVTIATNELFREEVGREGLIFAPIRPTYTDLTGNALREITERGQDPENGSRYIMEQLLLPHLKEIHEDLTAAVTGADVLISSVASIAASTVAAVTGVPWISTILSPKFALSPTDRASFLIGERLVTLPGLAPLNSLLLAIARRAYSSWADELNRFRLSLGLPTHPDPLIEGSQSDSLRLGLYSSLFAPFCGNRKNFFLTGFPRYDRYATYDSLPPDLESFLASGERPIVFTLGSSVVRIAGDFYIQSALAARNLGRRAVLLVGNNADPRLNDYLDDRIVAFPYVQHSLLFPHAAAIVHHGGIGTTASALHAGIPALIVPHAHDQPDNGRRARDLGVARVLPRPGYNATTATRELAPLLEKPVYREKARALGERIRAEDGAATAADLIEEFLAVGRTTLEPSTTSTEFRH